MIGLIEGNADLIEVAGGNPRSAETRRRLGVVQQAVGFPRSLTVGEIVGGAAARRGCPPEAASQAIAEMGLAGLEKRRAAKLSGGQQQRLQLAMGLLPIRFCWYWTSPPKDSMSRHGVGSGTRFGDVSTTEPVC